MPNIRSISYVTWMILKIFEITRFQIVGHFEFVITGCRMQNVNVIRSKSVPRPPLPSDPNLLINISDIS